MDLIMGIVMGLIGIGLLLLGCGTAHKELSNNKKIMSKKNQSIKGDFVWKNIPNPPSK